MTYNITNLANTSTMLGLVQNTNSVLVDGWFGTLFLVGVLVVLFLGYFFSTNDVKQSMAGTCFIGFVLSVIFDALNLVPTMMTFVLLAGAAFSVMMMWKK